MSLRMGARVVIDMAARGFIGLSAPCDGPGSKANDVEEPCDAGRFGCLHGFICLLSKGLVFGRLLEAIETRLEY